MSAVARITDIHTSVAEWKDDLTRVMASDVDPDKFIAAVTTALTMNPEIVAKCTPHSIKTACIKAAYDGLRPDGKEAALVAYGAEAQYMPMVFGIRKKAKDHDDIIITAREVREKDHFEVIYGLREDLIHNPDMSRDRGPIVATYAVYRKGAEVLHFEVMTAEDIDKVRAASKAPNSPAWRNWYGEMGKKAAVNRGSKAVPMSDAVRQVIERDNDLYDLNSVKDVTPARVPLGQALAAGKSQHNEGFSLSHVRSETGQVPMDTIDTDTGEVIEQNTEAQAGTSDRASTTQASRTASDKPSASADGGPGNADASTPAQQNSQHSSTAEPAAHNSLDAGSTPAAGTTDDAPISHPRSFFEEFSGALVRARQMESLPKAKDAFFKGKGIEVNEADKRLLQTIYKAHEDRIKGGLDAGKVLADVAGWIAEDVPEEKL